MLVTKRPTFKPRHDSYFTPRTFTRSIRRAGRPHKRQWDPTATVGDGNGGGAAPGAPLWQLLWRPTKRQCGLPSPRSRPPLTLPSLPLLDQWWQSGGGAAVRPSRTKCVMPMHPTRLLVCLYRPACVSRRNAASHGHGGAAFSRGGTAAAVAVAVFAGSSVTKTIATAAATDGKAQLRGLPFPSLAPSRGVSQGLISTRQSCPPGQFPRRRWDDCR